MAAVQQLRSSPQVLSGPVLAGSGMEHSGITVRRAGPEDSPGLSALFQTAYQHSSHPCKDSAFVSRTFANGDHWLVAVDGRRIVACQGVVIHPWNRVLEAARGITLPEYRGSGLATSMAQLTINAACQTLDGDLVISYPRNLTMHRILVETVTPRTVITGHDGAMNVANNRREYHLFGVFRKQSAAYAHFIPRRGTLANTTFVADSVFRPMGVSPQAGHYPDEFICGASPRPRHRGTFDVNYDPLCPSRSLEITAYNGGSHEARAVASQLEECIRSFGAASHVRVAVLVDKTEFIAELRMRGFRVTAYLPAWHRVGHARYDCVLMVRSQFDQEPADYNLRPVIDRFSEGLNP